MKGLVSTIDIRPQAATSARTSISSVDVYPVDKPVCAFYITIEAGVNVDTSLHYDLTMTITDPYVAENQTYTKNGIRLAPNNRGGASNVVWIQVPKSTIPKLVDEIYRTVDNEKAKATAAYNEFEDRMKYELGQQWSSGGAFPKYSYDEMQKLKKQEQDLYNAMNNVKVDFNAICRKYVKIVLKPIGLTITSPNGGEHWLIGDTVVITWKSVNYAGKVSIQLSYDGGNSGGRIITPATPNIGNYKWIVAGAVSTRCRMYISSIENNPELGTMSAADFTISAK